MRIKCSQFKKKIKKKYGKKKVSERQGKRIKSRTSSNAISTDRLIFFIIVALSF